MVRLTKLIATNLIKSGGYLGQPPKFDVGDIVIYRLAEFEELGFYPESPNWFGKQQFKILNMNQTVLGLPVLDIAWEYEVQPWTVNSRNFYFRRTFMEPQLEIVFSDASADIPGNF